MRYVLILGIMLLVSYSGLCQNKVTYSFTVEEKNKDSLNDNYPGASYEYKYDRLILNDSMFREIGLFSKDQNNTTELFKVVKGRWFFKNGNKWDVFYRSDKSIEPIIQISGVWYKLKIIQKTFYNGLKCIVYGTRSFNVDVSSSVNYWFNDKYGIIKIQTSEVVLVRSDVLVQTEK